MSYLSQIAGSDSYGPNQFTLPYQQPNPNNIHEITSYPSINGLFTNSGLNTLIDYKNYLYGPLGPQTDNTINEISGSGPEKLGGRFFGQVQNRVLTPGGVSTSSSTGYYFGPKKLKRSKRSKRSKSIKRKLKRSKSIKRKLKRSKSIKRKLKKSRSKKR